MPLVASPTSDALLYSIDYPTFLYIHLDISIISIFPCICRCMYISYSVMVILAWIVLVCDDDNTVVYNKREWKLSDATQPPGSWLHYIDDSFAIMSLTRAMNWGLLKVSRLKARLPTLSAELQNCDKIPGKNLSLKNWTILLNMLDFVIGKIIKVCKWTRTYILLIKFLKGGLLMICLGQKGICHGILCHIEWTFATQLV